MTKEQITTWAILGVMLTIVGVLVILWVTTYSTVMRADQAAGQSANLPFSSVGDQFRELGKVVDAKLANLGKAFTDEVPALTNSEEPGQLTNAGLSNQQITELEQHLFENTAPQQ